MTIRPAVMADLVEILALDRAVATAPHWTEKTYMQALSDARGRCIFVAVDSELTGFAVGSIVEDQAEIESVVVSANNRRHGFGRGLCEAVIAWACAAGARVISLEVRASNSDAIAFYQSLQFCRAGQRRLYYTAPAEDALILRITLRRRDD